MCIDEQTTKLRLVGKGISIGKLNSTHNMFYSLYNANVRK